MQIPVSLFSMPSGETLTLRSTHPDDAASLLCHQQITSGETDFMARYPEECTGTLAAMQERLHLLEQHLCSFTVTAFCGDRVVGDLMVTPVRPHIKYLPRAFKLKDGTYRDEIMMIQFLNEAPCKREGHT